MPTLALTLLLATGAPPVDWQAPPGCPQLDEVRQEVSRLVQDASGAGQVSARAAIRTGPLDDYVLTLRIERPGATARYELAGQDCAALAGAAAVLIATAIDAGDRVPDFPEPSAATPPHPAPAPATASSSRLPFSRLPSSRLPSSRLHGSRLQGSLESGYFVGVGRESPVSHGPQVGASLLLLRRLRVTALARASLPITYSPQPERRVVVHAWHGTLKGCARLSAGPLEVPVCLVTEAGWITARGRGWTENNAVRRPSVAAGLGLGLRARLGRRLAITVDTETMVPLVFPRLTVDGIPVWRPALVGARFMAGVELRLGRSTR